MTLAGKRVLVTGAGGFVGSHLTEALVRSGARTRALVNYHSQGSHGYLDQMAGDVLDEVEIISGDIRDFQRVRQAVDACDIVFHLAALIGIPYSNLAPASYVQVNVEGTLHVLTACREAGVANLVHTSTSEVYGTPQHVPIEETHRLHAQSPYAATKIAADQLALSFHAAYDVPVTIVRPFNTYGPRQSARAVIPTIIAQALCGGSIRLGNTDTVRDFLYVSDSVEGYLAAARSPAAGQVVQLGTGTGVSISDVVDRVASIVGRELEVVCDLQRRRSDSSEVRQLICCADKACALLGWRPRIDLDQGLRRTIEWIEAHQTEYRVSQYCI